MCVTRIHSFTQQSQRFVYSRTINVGKAEHLNITLYCFELLAAACSAVDFGHVSDFCLRGHWLDPPAVIYRPADDDDVHVVIAVRSPGLGTVLGC